MKPIVRFAPSPTGYLHIGNARSALLNWLYAKSQGGTFVLRLDDTDTERSRACYADAIIEDLAWLGIVPDRTFCQSDRIARYDQVADKLRREGRLYACYETPDELERKRKRQLSRGQPPIYDRAALTLSADEQRAYKADGRKPHWRFKLAGRRVQWNDLVRGHQAIETMSLSDPVLVRADGSYLYTLPSVVDDIEMDMTHVIRGEDHVTNTGVQIELFAALGHKAPVFAHNNLLTSADGTGFSKREGSLSLRALRAAGIEPAAVASLASLLGSAAKIAPYQTLDDLAKVFDLRSLSRAPAQFDEKSLASLSARTLHEMPFALAATRLQALGLEITEPFWLAVRDNVSQLQQVREWMDVVYGDLEISDDGWEKAAGGGDDAGFIKSALEAFPPEPWDAATWTGWTRTLGEKSGRKGKALYLPLRIALTGKDHGPDLKVLLPLIGPSQVRKRLSAARDKAEAVSLSLSPKA